MLLLPFHKNNLEKLFFELINKYFSAEHPFSKDSTNKSYKLSFFCLPVEQNPRKLFIKLIINYFPAVHSFSIILIINQLTETMNNDPKR